jgi:peroxiredoxin family protein
MRYGGISLEEEKSVLIDEFIQNAIIHGLATLEGNSKKGNKSSDKIFKIREIMKKDEMLAREMLDELLYNNEVNVKIWACGTALDIGYKTKVAEQILIDISNNPELGIFAFDAKMSLKVRKDKI